MFPICRFNSVGFLPLWTFSRWRDKQDVMEVKQRGKAEVTETLSDVT